MSVTLFNHHHFAPRVAVAFALAAALAGAAGCSAAQPSPAPTASGRASTSVDPATCGLQGAAKDVATLCLTTDDATDAAAGAIKELYRPAIAVEGAPLQLALDSLNEDGSLAGYTVPAAVTDEEQAAKPGHPAVGMVTKDGFKAFSRDTAATALYAVTGLDRDGDAVTWLEETGSTEGQDGGDWVAYSATSGAVSEVTTRSAMPENLQQYPLDGNDPGPVIVGKQVQWRIGTDVVETSETPGDAISPVLLTAPLSGGKATQSDLDLGISNRDADGGHYFLADTGEETSYQIIHQDAAGEETVIYTDTKGEYDTVDDPRVLDGTVVWAVQTYPADETDETDGTDGEALDDGAAQDPLVEDLTDDDTLDDGTLDDGTLDDGTLDDGTLDENPVESDDAMTDLTDTPGATGADATSASPTPEPATSQGSAALFAYKPAAKRLVRIQTADPDVTALYVSVAGDRIGWAGITDPKQYVADLATSSIVSIGACDQCGQVGVGPGGTLVWMTPGKDADSLPQPVVGRLPE